jgi:inhibitor of KinA
MWPRVVRLGEETWLVEFEPRLSADVNARILALADKLERLRLQGIRDVVPAYASLAVHADLDRVDGGKLQQTLERLAAEPPRRERPGRLHEIPVCYAPEYGLDLDALCQAVHCTVQEAISRHVAIDYRVFMLGFLPGFPYLGVVDERIAIPRRDTPRAVVPAGSVGIAGQQTGIYPTESPGGWQIVGRTPVRLFDHVGGTGPLLRAGDRVRFTPIDAERYAELARQPEATS